MLLRPKDEGIPQELKALKAWNVWRNDMSEDFKDKKVPYQLNGQRAKSNDPSQWRTWDEAWNYYQVHSNEYCGIAFLLNGNYTIVDIDNCLDDHGQPNPLAKELIEKCNTATFKSSSGKGVHMLFKGGLYKAGFPKVFYKGQKLEAYCASHYFALTGIPLGATKSAAKLNGQLEGIVPSQPLPVEPRPMQPALSATAVPTTQLERARAWLAKVPPENEGCRNNKLNEISFTMRMTFDIPQQEFVALLMAWALACNPPMDDREAIYTIRRAWEDAARKGVAGKKVTEGPPAPECSYTTTALAEKPPAPKAAPATAPTGRIPDFANCADVMAYPPDRPDELIKDIAFVGGKLALNAPSKAHKTFMQMHLAICIACGIPWFSKKVKQGPVLYINLELIPYSFWARLDAICNKLQAKLPPDGLDVWHLRGCNLPIEKLHEELIRRINASGKKYSLIILDPIYKVWGDRGENTGEIVGVLQYLEAITFDSGAALLHAHHFAKGNAASKDTLDRASGHGSLGRDGDTIMTMTPHEGQNCFTLEIIQRDFAPLPKAVLEWVFPMYDVRPDLDPEQLKLPDRRKFTHTGGSPPADIKVEDILACITSTPRTRSQVIEELMGKTGFKDRSCRAALSGVLDDSEKHGIKWEKLPRPGGGVPVYRCYR